MTKAKHETDELEGKAGDNGDNTNSADTPRRSGSGALATGIAILALVTAIGTTGAGYYLYSRKIQPLLQLPGHLEEVQQQSERKVTEANQAVEARLAGLNKTLSLLQQGDELNQQRFHGLEESLDKIRGQAFWTSREWKLAEVRYLVQIAQDRIQLMHDNKTAETALVAALGRLAELTDPSLEPLRQRLQHDIQRITVPNDEDPLIVIAKLEALASAVKPFPHAAAVVSHNNPSENADTPPAQSPLDLFTTIVKSRVKIVHHEQSLNALDRNRVAGYQLELLKLRIEAIRLALLQRNSKAYQHELNGIKLWLEENAGLGLTGKISAEVDRLLTLKPFEVAPNLQPTLDSLGQLLSNNIHLPAESGAGNAS